MSSLATCLRRPSEERALPTFRHTIIHCLICLCEAKSNHNSHYYFCARAETTDTILGQSWMSSQSEQWSRDLSLHGASQSSWRSCLLCGWLGFIRSCRAEVVALFLRSSLASPLLRRSAGHNHVMSGLHSWLPRTDLLALLVSLYGSKSWKQLRIKTKLARCPRSKVLNPQHSLTLFS